MQQSNLHLLRKVLYNVGNNNCVVQNVAAIEKTTNHTHQLFQIRKVFPANSVLYAPKLPFASIYWNQDKEVKLSLAIELCLSTLALPDENKSIS
jgi:hypothetical protein